MIVPAIVALPHGAVAMFSTFLVVASTARAFLDSTDAERIDRGGMKISVVFSTSISVRFQMRLTNSAELKCRRAENSGND